MKNDSRKGGGSPKGKRKLNFVEKKDKLPLTGKSIFVDVKETAQCRVIKEDIRKLGARVDEFFHKDINYVITSNWTSRPDKNDALKSPESPSMVSTPSPFNCGPSPSPASGSKLPPESVTRGRAIAKRAITKETNPVLTNAEKLGIKIVTLDAAQKWIQREIAKLPQNKKSKSLVNNHLGSCKVKKLKSPYMKIESFTRQYKVIYQQIDLWPHANVETPRGTCPFDGTSVGGEKSREDRGDRIGLIPLEPRTPETKSAQKESAKTPDHSKSSHKKQRPTAQRSGIIGGVRIVTAGELRRRTEMKRLQEKKKGYCECCETKYDDLSKHVREEQHKAFIRDKKHYQDLDRLINSGPNDAAFLQRVLQQHCSLVNGIHSKGKSHEKQTAMQHSDQKVAESASKSTTIKIANSAVKSSRSPRKIWQKASEHNRSKLLKDGVDREIRRCREVQNCSEVDLKLENHYVPARTRNFLFVQGSSGQHSDIFTMGKRNLKTNNQDEDGHNKVTDYSTAPELQGLVDDEKALGKNTLRARSLQKCDKNRTSVGNSKSDRRTEDGQLKAHHNEIVEACEKVTRSPRKHSPVKQIHSSGVTKNVETTSKEISDRTVSPAEHSKKASAKTGSGLEECVIKRNLRSPKRASAETGSGLEECVIKRNLRSPKRASAETGNGLEECVIKRNLRSPKRASAETGNGLEECVIKRNLRSPKRASAKTGNRLEECVIKRDLRSPKRASAETGNRLEECVIKRDLRSPKKTFAKTGYGLKECAIKRNLRSPKAIDLPESNDKQLDEPKGDEPVKQPSSSPNRPVERGVVSEAGKSDDDEFNVQRNSTQRERWKGASSRSRSASPLKKVKTNDQRGSESRRKSTRVCSKSTEQNAFNERDNDEVDQRSSESRRKSTRVCSKSTEQNAFNERDNDEVDQRSSESRRKSTRVCSKSTEQVGFNERDNDEVDVGTSDGERLSADLVTETFCSVGSESAKDSQRTIQTNEVKQTANRNSAITKSPNTVRSSKITDKTDIGSSDCTSGKVIDPARFPGKSIDSYSLEPAHNRNNTTLCKYRGHANRKSPTKNVSQGRSKVNNELSDNILIKEQNVTSQPSTSDFNQQMNRKKSCTRAINHGLKTTSPMKQTSNRSRHSQRNESSVGGDDIQQNNENSYVNREEVAIKNANDFSPITNQRVWTFNEDQKRIENQGSCCEKTGKEGILNESGILQETCGKEEILDAEMEKSLYYIDRVHRLRSTNQRQNSVVRELKDISIKVQEKNSGPNSPLPEAIEEEPCLLSSPMSKSSPRKPRLQTPSKKDLKQIAPVGSASPKSGVSTTPRSDTRRRWKKRKESKSCEMGSSIRRVKRLEKLKYLADSKEQNMNNSAHRKQSGEEHMKNIESCNGVRNEVMDRATSENYNLKTKLPQSLSEEKQILKGTCKSSLKNLRSPLKQSSSEMKCVSPERVCTTLVWKNAKGSTPKRKKKKIKLNHSWSVLSDRSVNKLLHESDSESNFEGFEEGDVTGHSSLCSDASFIEIDEVEFEDSSDHEWELEPEKVEENQVENPVVHILPEMFSSPNKRSDSSWDTGFVDFIDTHLSSRQVTSQKQGVPLDAEAGAPLCSPRRRKRLESIPENSMENELHRRKKRRKVEKEFQSYMISDVAAQVDEDIQFNFASPNKRKSKDPLKNTTEDRPVNPRKSLDYGSCREQCKGGKLEAHKKESSERRKRAKKHKKSKKKNALKIGDEESCYSESPNEFAYTRERNSRQRDDCENGINSGDNTRGSAEDKSMPCLSPKSKTCTRNSTPDSRRTSDIPCLSPQIQNEDLSNLSPDVSHSKSLRARKISKWI